MHVSMHAHHQDSEIMLDDESEEGGHDYHNNWFTTDLPQVVLFQSWILKDTKDLLICCLLVAMFSFAYEWVKHIRTKVQKQNILQQGVDAKENNRVSQIIPDNENKLTSKCTCKRYASLLTANCLLYGVQLFMGYSLMLLVMSFHVYIILSIVIGCMSGLFSTQFQWKKKTHTNNNPTV